MDNVIDMSYSFMAFAKGKTDGENFRKPFIGLGVANILAVNPDRKKWNEIFNSNTNTEPIVYTGTRDVDGKPVNTARITFILKLDPKFNNGIDAIVPINFNLEKRYRVSRDGSKVQVIDEYCRTTWVTKDELKTHSIPVFSNGPAKISTNYRPVLRGEENLVKFMKAFLRIDDVEVYNNDTGRYEENKDKASCVIMLDHINDYFDGKFDEIFEGVNLQPDNRVKVLFGVRHTDNNRDYQDFFNGYFMKSNQISVKILKRELENSKNSGMYPNTDFKVDTISIYEGPVATSFEEKVATSSVFDDDPFASESNKDDDLPFGF